MIDARIGDRVIVAGNWNRGYGDSSYEADIVEVSLESSQAVVRDDTGSRIPVGIQDLVMVCPTPRGEADA
jgi:hypothetical protein